MLKGVVIFPTCGFHDFFVMGAEIFATALNTVFCGGSTSAERRGIVQEEGAADRGFICG